MNLEELRELQRRIENMASSAMQIDGPSIANTSFIPTVQRSNVLLMTSKPLQAHDMTTIFIGVIRQNYTDAMWQFDVTKWITKLGNQRYFYIQMQPLEGRDATNSNDAIPKMEQALLDMNQIPAGEKLRVIMLGTGHSTLY